MISLQSNSYCLNQIIDVQWKLVAISQVFLMPPDLCVTSLKFISIITIWRRICLDLRYTQEGAQGSRGEHKGAEGSGGERRGAEGSGAERRGAEMSSGGERRGACQLTRTKKNPTKKKSVYVVK